MPLLTPEEESLAREPASFARLMGEREYDARRLLIENRGLGAVYHRDAAVYAVMQMYIGGHLTWQGALLLAYRHLTDNQKAYQLELDKFSLAQDFRDYPPTRTLETVTSKDVVNLSCLCAILIGMCVRVQSVLGSPTLRIQLGDITPKVLARIPNAERGGE